MSSYPIGGFCLRGSPRRRALCAITGRAPMDRGTRPGENAWGDDGVESGWGLLVGAGVGGGRRGGDGDSPVPNRPAQAELDLSLGSGDGRGGVAGRRRPDVSSRPTRPWRTSQWDDGGARYECVRHRHHYHCGRPHLAPLGTHLEPLRPTPPTRLLGSSRPLATDPHARQESVPFT